MVAQNLKTMIKEVLEPWLIPRLAGYQDPERVGVPKGSPIGLSKKKFHAAQLQVLHSDAFPLRELADEVGVSHVQMRVWRSELEFKKAVEEAVQEFLQYISEEALKTWHDEKQFDMLLYCLAMHKEGLLTLFFKWNKEAGNIFKQLISNINDVTNYSLLFDNMSFLGVFIHKFIKSHPPEDRTKVKDVMMLLFYPHIEKVLNAILEIVANKNTTDEIKEECKKIIRAIALFNWAI